MGRLLKNATVSFVLILAICLSSLAAVQERVQADTVSGTSDNVTSPMNQPGSGTQVQNRVCNTNNDGGVMETTSEYILIDVDCWHEGHCWVCDEYQDYACNYGGYEPCFLSPCPFVDPVPEGNIVTRIEAEVNSLPCINNVCGPIIDSLIDVYINNTLVGSGTQTGTCCCDHCYPLSISSEIYVNGFPGYVYGGENGLGIEADDICMSDVHVKLYYEESPPPTPPIPAVAGAAKGLDQSTGESESTTLRSPSLNTNNLAVNPSQTVANNPVTISANVVNEGGMTGSTRVALKVNGQVEQTKMVTVGGGSSRPVKFTVTKAEPGTYTVIMGSQRASFLVTEDTAGGTNVDGGIIAIILLVLAAAAVVIVLAFSFGRRPA